MTTLMTIGEFSRLTHLSVKALHHYHDVGLLVPHVDPVNNYRLYDTAQVPTAHLVRRLRDLDMPLAEVGAVLAAPDGAARDRAILTHLRRMEQRLTRTQDAVASLRDMLEHPAPLVDVEHRTVAAVTALAVRARVARDDIAAFCASAFPELYAAAGGAVSGVPGALYSDAFFTDACGDVVVYVPVAAGATTGGAAAGGASTGASAVGRVAPFEVPAATVAVTVHAGGYADIDRTYGALGTHVAALGIGAPGAIRERYLVGPDATDDVGRLRTEICWPITQGAH